MQYLFMVKTLRNEELKQIFHPDRGHYEKPIVTIVLNGERVNAFPLR